MTTTTMGPSDVLNESVLAMRPGSHPAAAAASSTVALGGEFTVAVQKPKRFELFPHFFNAHFHYP